MKILTRYKHSGRTLLLSLAAALTLPAIAADTQFLEPEQAFRMSAKPLDADHVEVSFVIEPKHYLYQDKFRFRADNGVAIETPSLPPAEIKQDKFSGKQKSVYHHDMKIVLPIASVTTPFVLNVTAQGCAEAGLCYPPFTQRAEISPLQPTGVATTIEAAQTTAPVASVPADESSKIGSMLRDAGVALTLASFFGFGLLLAFTPCVFPMIPILSGIIIGHGDNISKNRALLLSVMYVLGMAITYTVAGVAAGLSGTMLSSALQNVWVLSAFALIFVVLSLSMFNVYQLQLPAGLQGRLSESANRQGGSITGVAMMGALSALIVGPCVAAPLAGALLYIAQTRDAVLGGAALFCMALGMGAPLVAVGVAARTVLPRAGMWMENVKKIFGVLLLAVAIWIVSPVASPLFTMLAIAALALFCGVFLHALDSLPSTATSAQRLGKGVGVVAVTFSLALIVGALAGSRDALQPLAFLKGGIAVAQAASETSGSAPQFTRVADTKSLNTHIDNADKPVLLDFYADWCVSCKEMEHLTFADPKVAARLREVTLLQADVTENSAPDKALMKRFGIFGPPAIIVLDKQGKELTRVVGFKPAPEFAEVLDQALADYQPE